MELGKAFDHCFIFCLGLLQPTSLCPKIKISLQPIIRREYGRLVGTDDERLLKFHALGCERISLAVVFDYGSTSSFCLGHVLHKENLRRLDTNLLAHWSATRNQGRLSSRPEVLFSRHALHEKSLQIQKDVVSLLGIRERRAHVVLLTTAYKLIVKRKLCSCIRFTWDFADSCFRSNVQAICHRSRKAYEGCLYLDDLFCRRPVLPNPAPQLRPAPRPNLQLYVRVFV